MEVSEPGHDSHLKSFMENPAFVISVQVKWPYGQRLTFSSAFTPTNLRQFFHFVFRQVKIRPVVHWFGAKLLIEGDC